MTSSREQRRQLYERLVGQTIAGRYDIISLMGFGGMGAVYEAVQKNMNRRIALKFIPSHNPITAARFEREALTVSQLCHPNTVTVFDYGQTEDGFLYLTMELLEGRTLTELIEKESPVPAARAIHIASQICRSLSEAHRMGIVHRDIKPDNIFLIEVDGDPDVVKVLDFGIAKVVSGEDDVQLTGDGRIIGTPRYMSPEQILSQDIDHRSDIYSLGCIIFEMLCAAPPFQQSSTTALMVSHAKDPPPPFAERLSEDALGQIPLALEHVVRKSLTKSPDDRQQTTDALREELEDAQSSLGFGGTRDRGASGRFLVEAAGAPGEGKKRPLALIAIVIALVLIAAFSVSMILGVDDKGSSLDDELALIDKPEAVEVDTEAPEVRLQLSVASEPPGASVMDGEDELGTTPMQIALPGHVESVVYTLRLEGHEDREVEITLEPHTTRRQGFSFLLTPKAEDETEDPQPEAIAKQEEPKKVVRPPRKTRRDPPPTAAAQTTKKVETEDTSKTKTEETGTHVPRIERLEDRRRPDVERL